MVEVQRREGAHIEGHRKSCKRKKGRIYLGLEVLSRVKTVAVIGGKWMTKTSIFAK